MERFNDTSRKYRFHAVLCRWLEVTLRRGNNLRCVAVVSGIFSRGGIRYVNTNPIIVVDIIRKKILHRDNRSGLDACARRGRVWPAR